MLYDLWQKHGGVEKNISSNSRVHTIGWNSLKTACVIANEPNDIYQFSLFITNYGGKNNILSLFFTRACTNPP